MTAGSARQPLHKKSILRHYHFNGPVFAEAQVARNIFMDKVRCRIALLNQKFRCGTAKFNIGKLHHKFNRGNPPFLSQQALLVFYVVFLQKVHGRAADIFSFFLKFMIA